MHGAIAELRTCLVLLGLVLLGVASLSMGAPLQAAVITLNNGLQYEGKLGKVGGLAQNPNQSVDKEGQTGAQLIVLVNDELRRTFVSKYQVREVRESELVSQERITIPQRVAHSDKYVSGVGSIIDVTEFDAWGRRIFSMNVTGRGRVDVVQGITLITPEWTKVEGLQGDRPVAWDMRIATSSIPQAKLSEILMRQLDSDDPNDRLRIVRLYIQGERYSDASAELQNVIRNFPELKDLEKQVTSLRQLVAQQLLDEIKLRRKSGQHRLAHGMLTHFPDEKVAGETLLTVRQMLDEYATADARGKRVLGLLDENLALLEDGNRRARLQPVRDEIAAELNMNNLDRFADFLRLADDATLSPDQKVSLAVSGWLLGSGAGRVNLSVSTSLIEVRRLVRRYLRSTGQAERMEILEQLRTHEGGAPSYVARLAAHMKPALDLPDPEPHAEGLYRMSVPGLTGQADNEYLLQLPPEYDPYRRYPVVVTMHSVRTTPSLQIDWWSGAAHPQTGARSGQGTRNGYIVIAPQWTKPHQRKYEFSAREHAAALHSLRDAARRVSIDTDRTFLSGHSIGGDAVWDIGLAHPDVWAGVIPLVAVADKYVARYWENAKSIPFYFVMGELDGDKLGRNSRDLDRYLTRVGFDATIVEYLGRGHEHFQDEVHRIYRWMDAHQRPAAPPEIITYSMRPWDNFFWWIELDRMPLRSMVTPVSWPPARGVHPVKTKGSILRNNHLRLETGAGRVTAWLSPEFVDFEKKITITVNGRSHSNPDDATPSTAVLLEDIRSRGDRLHPFWARVQLPTGRGGR